MPVPTQIDSAIAILGAVLSAIAVFRIPKDALDRLPLSGLILLLLFYVLVGWGAAIAKFPSPVWIAIGIALVLQKVLASIQLGRFGLIAFVLAAGSAIGFALRQESTLRLIAIGFALFGIWAWTVGGARYRLERSGFRRLSVFWILAIVLAEGLWIGWLIDTFVAPQVGTWLMQSGVF